MKLFKQSFSILMALIVVIGMFVAFPSAAVKVSDETASGVTASPASYPRITQATSVDGGLKLKWSAYKGAAKYRVYIKSAGSWKGIAATAETSCVHTAVKSGTTYTYTVRALDQNDNFITGYDPQGFSAVYYSKPSSVFAESVNGGVRISWKAVKGAKKYCVCIKKSDGWTPLAYTAATHYTDTAAVSGKTYRYTVRVCSEDGKLTLSAFDRTGAAVTYFSAPVITGFAPVNGGTRISWKSVGAAKYRLYIKKSGTWQKVADTAGTSYDHKKLKDGTSYTYTVRAMDKKGNFVSGYDTTGKIRRYLAPPKITSVTKKSGGTLIKWNAKANADGYLVYRKTYGGAWKELGRSRTASYTDKTAAKNTAYGYTVRCIDKKGRAASCCYNNKKYYANGQLATGKLKAGKTSLYFSKGVVCKGYTKLNGKTYYFKSGNLQKNGLVGTKKEGIRYADKNGVVQMNYTGIAKNSKGWWYVYKGKVNFTVRNGITWNGDDWNIVDGRAYQVKTLKDRTFHRALKIAARVTDSSMTKSQKLRAVWNHLQSDYGECSPRGFGNFDISWVETYANDIFVDHTGDCFSYGAAFAYLAKAVGYTESYACNSGGHGWTEIDGLLYDAEWSMHSSKYTYYAMSYDDPCDVPYKSALQLGSDWSHVKV